MKNNIIVEETINKLNDICGFNILEKTRQRNYIEARSVLYYVLNKENGFTTQYIADLLSLKGYYYNRSNITHSINNFKIYCNYSEFCKNLYLQISDNAVVFDGKVREKSELELYLEKLDVSFHSELLEAVKLKVDSFSWKLKNNYEIINTY